MTRRTGAGALVNPDNVVIYGITVAILTLASLAPLVASVNGLLHVAAWYLPELFRWTLPFAFDAMMIGCAIAALALRRRHAWLEAWVTTGITVVLVLASAVANWLEVYARIEAETIQGDWSPWIKAAMPVLTYAGFEVIAMLTSTRKQGENAPLRVARAEVKSLRSELRALRKQIRKSPAVGPLADGVLMRIGEGEVSA